MEVLGEIVNLVVGNLAATKCFRINQLFRDNLRRSDWVRPSRFITSITDTDYDGLGKLGHP